MVETLVSDRQETDPGFLVHAIKWSVIDMDLLMQISESKHTQGSQGSQLFTDAIAFLPPGTLLHTMIN